MSRSRKSQPTQLLGYNASDFPTTTASYPTLGSPLGSHSHNSTHSHNHSHNLSHSHTHRHASPTRTSSRTTVVAFPLGSPLDSFQSPPSPLQSLVATPVDVHLYGVPYSEHTQTITVTIPPRSPSEVNVYATPVVSGTSHQHLQHGSYYPTPYVNPLQTGFASPILGSPQTEGLYSPLSPLALSLSSPSYASANSSLLGSSLGSSSLGNSPLNGSLGNSWNSPPQSPRRSPRLSRSTSSSRLDLPSSLSSPRW